MVALKSLACNPRGSLVVLYMQLVAVTSFFQRSRVICSTFGFNRSSRLPFHRRTIQKATHSFYIVVLSHKDIGKKRYFDSVFTFSSSPAKMRFLRAFYYSYCKEGTYRRIAELTVEKKGTNDDLFILNLCMNFGDKIKIIIIVLHSSLSVLHSSPLSLNRNIYTTTL
jgi:hypothetical protein